MGEFHYVDLFATKGIEYIAVIIYLLLLVPFWKFLTGNSDSSSGKYNAFSESRSYGNRKVEVNK